MKLVPLFPDPETIAARNRWRRRARLASIAAGALVCVTGGALVAIREFWPPATVDLGTTEDIVAIAAARETFERCSGDECRFLAWTPALVAISRAGEVAVRDPRHGWVRHPAQGGVFLAAAALFRFDQADDPLLLVGEDGRIRRGVPHP